MKNNAIVYFIADGSTHEDNKGEIILEYISNGDSMLMVRKESGDVLHVKPCDIYKVMEMPFGGDILEGSSYEASPIPVELRNSSNPKVELGDMFVITNYQEQTYLKTNPFGGNVEWSSNKNDCFIFYSEDTAKLALLVLEQIGKSFLKIEKIEFGEIS